MVVGAGPNGLSAAIRLAQAGLAVTVFEGAAEVGGSARSMELTLPGFVHDVCSAIHPLAVGSPFFNSLPLTAHGLEWVHPAAPLAHPLADGGAVVLERSLLQTALGLGSDGGAYRRLLGPLLNRWSRLVGEILGPLRLPRDPLTLARFGCQGLRSAAGLSRRSFRSVAARALFAGLAAHAVLPLEHAGTAAFGLLLGLAGHAVGWPMPRGGAGAISRALAAYLRSLGGTVITHCPIESLADLPTARAVVLDVSPPQLIALCGPELPPAYVQKLRRYRYGPAVFKMDWALHSAIPWRHPECARAGTVHLGGTLEEIADSERAAWNRQYCNRPFVLLAQPSLFDRTRVPPGKHSAWAYCHVPQRSTRDMTAEIEHQVERFAPGFRDCIAARATCNAEQLQRTNPNCIGGDISGGANDLRQLWCRPLPAVVPYATPNPRLFLCSASTPPGGGVHGMCGYHAAGAVLTRLRGRG